MLFDEEPPESIQETHVLSQSIGSQSGDRHAQTGEVESARDITSACPPREALARLGNDSLRNASLAAIDEHVEKCAFCEAELDRIAHDASGGEESRPEMVPLRGELPAIPGFIIKDELGRGGMGVVYRAYDPRLEHHVALKVVPGDALAGPHGRRRWLAEAYAISRVRHPNVVHLYDCGEAGTWFYLVFEYIPGGSLEKRLNGDLAPRVAAGLVETIARAVAHFHEARVRHLDLKPSNILLDGGEFTTWDRVVPRISDFGLASVIEREAGRKQVLVSCGERPATWRQSRQRHPATRSVQPPTSMAWAHPLCPVDRTSAFPGNNDARNAGSSPGTRARTSPATRSQHTSRPRNDHPQVLGEKSDPSLCLGRDTR